MNEPPNQSLGNLDPSRTSGLTSITARAHPKSLPATMMLSPNNRRLFKKARFQVIVNTCCYDLLPPMPRNLEKPLNGSCSLIPDEPQTSCS